MSLNRDHVGQRVIVRRLLPGETGPSGGPAMTDVLGVLTAFDSSALAVERDDGELVTVPLADLVTGKPIPPRAVARMRISPEQLQRVCSDGWRALVEEPLGEWLLRSSAGFTGRANSARVGGDPGVSIDLALERVMGFYREHGQRPLTQVVVGSPWVQELASRGWVQARQDEADTAVQVVSVAQARRVRRATAADVSRVELDADLDESWLDVYGRTAGMEPQVARQVLTQGDTCFARIGQPAVAIGRGVVSGDWLGIAAVEVRADRRREGLARTVVETLLSWGAAKGALSAYLQTLEDNAAAQALFSRFGFEIHHLYRYLTPGG